MDGAAKPVAHGGSRSGGLEGRLRQRSRSTDRYHCIDIHEGTDEVKSPCPEGLPSSTASQSEAEREPHSLPDNSSADIDLVVHTE